jgi:hypothetical protein
VKNNLPLVEHEVNFSGFTELSGDLN